MSEIDMSLLPDFIVEAEEHLEEMELMLLQLIEEPGSLELLNDIFRPIHTIKGGAQYIGLQKVSKLAHSLEDLLDLMREGKKKSSSEIIETLIEARDRIALLVGELSASSCEESSVDDLVALLTGMLADGKAVEVVAPAQDEMTTPQCDYQEEEDEELFSVFLTHLQENYTALVTLTRELPQSSDCITLLNESQALLDALHSSANYMGYDELVGRYNHWRSEIEQAIEAVIQGTSPSFNFMLDISAELKERFPQLKDVDESVGDVTDDVMRAFAEMEAAGESEPDLPEGSSDPQPTTGEDVTEDVMRAFAEMEAAGGSEPDLPESSSDPQPPTGEDVTDDVMRAFAEMEAAGGVELAPERPASEDEPQSTSEIDLVLLPDFLVEAEEHLEEMEEMLLQLMKEPGNLELLNDIFRPIHTLKGGAQYIGLDRISRLSHSLEDLLDLLREGEKSSSSEIIETLMVARDRIALLVKELTANSCETSSVDDLLTILAAITKGDATGGMTTAESVKPQDEIAQTAAIYQEEEDEELFVIFLEHLQENYTGLILLAQELPQSSDKIELLNQSLVLINALRSSANYMEYVELVERYQVWIGDVEQAVAHLTQGEQVELDLMESYLTELRRTFPQLTDVTPAPAPVSDPSNIKVVINEPVVGGLEDTLLKRDSTARSSSAEQVKPPSELYNNLSSALDTSLSQGSNAEDYKNLQHVFDELVSKNAGSAPSSEVQASKKVTPSKPAASAAVKEQKPSKMARKIKKSVRVDADKIDALMNQVGELVVDRSYFFQLFNEMRDLQRHLKETVGLEQKDVKLVRTFIYRLSEAIAALGRTSNELQEGVMKMRMLPISQIFNRYPRLIHDLTRNSDKQVNLIMKGEETELDRMIVEELSDPLIHLIRNAVDHGIESCEMRLKAGKPEKATLVLEAYHESNHVVIEVTDDGRGIDPEKIRKKALEKELFSAEELENMSTNELIPLILTAGFSTADKITGTSGRGVGMDVVKKNIEKLNGSLEIDSKLGIGSQIRLKIPLTLAIIHALMVRVGGDLFTIPLANVEETVRVFKHEISMVEGVEIIHLRGQTLPIFRLSTVFNEKCTERPDKSFVVIVSVGGQRTGFVVDELLGQEEVVIKPLADYVQEKSGFSGATIIGDGRISLILDVYELVRMTAKRQAKKQLEQTDKIKSKIKLH
ncbi:MAG: Hpt domain-containing protein [Candidatus Polarisedimenticolaceae bacterium]|nr:Hpt domain-containing protein [Candidatus Polarisedimenticolaceae bacterium]